LAQEFSTKKWGTVCKVPGRERDKVLSKYPNRTIHVVWKAGSLEEDHQEEILQLDA